MGSGKSTVGREVGHRLGWKVSDSDTLILASTGKMAAEHAEESGADYSHQLEAEHLRTALAATSPTVICAAGIVVDDEHCRLALRAPYVTSVWLRASTETLTNRFHSEAHRPRYTADLFAMFAAQTASRASQFADLSGLVIDVDGRSSSDIADEVCSKVLAIWERQSELSPDRSLQPVQIRSSEFAEY
jgi:shikimate kinase